jgi:hypothetical protein
MTTIATTVGRRTCCPTATFLRCPWVVEMAGNIGGLCEMTVTDRDEVDDLPEVHDELGAAIGQIIAHVFAELPIDCPERRAALCTIIECHTRVAGLLRQPRLN